MISIELVLLVLIAVIMFFSILTGLCQGFRKNMFKLVATILFWVIFWVTAPLVKGKFFWYNEGFYQLLAPMLNGTQYANLMEFILASIANAIGMDPATLADPAIENTFIAVAMCIIKIVYLIVLAIVYGIVKSIVYKVRFKYFCKINKKVVRKLEKKQKRFVKKNGRKDLKLELEIEKKREALKKNKIYRPLGMVSGFARGCLSSFLILCLINSTFRLLPENNQKDDVTASTNSYESTPSIYDFILEYTNNDPNVEMAVSMINEYQSSTLMNITGIKIGARTADELFIDSILSGKSEDYSFAIRKELQSIVRIAEEAFYLTNGFDMESVNWTALNNAQVESIQTILTILSDDDLINNLGSVMVGIAISLDAVAPYMPENLSSVEYEEIDWGGELATIADLVASVYSLGDLSQLDFMQLDESVVEEIIVTLSELDSINFLGHVGANFAIKSLVGDNEEYEETVAVIEDKLAQLAVNNGYSDTIYAYKDLYADFIEIFESETLDKYKDEDGKITNYVSALTSVDTTKYSNIVNTVLEANFVNEILPDVLTIVKEELIPEEYSSLINPGIVTTSQWENEINAAFTIINSITDKGAHPFDTIETFDFALLSNFSTETVVKSELLSYAMIKIFVDTSKEEGILAEEAEGLSDFISVPDTLAVAADPATHKFAAKWYGSEQLNYEDGELFIMLDTVKNCAAQLENLDNPEGSLPAILASIDENKIVESDVLYYSLNKMVDQVNEYIIVPVEETTRSSDTVNGQYVNRMIKKDSLKQVLDIFTDSNIVDLESLLSYYEILEDGSLAEEATDKNEIDEEDLDNYKAKFDMSTDKVLGLLTSKKLYDPETNNSDNLDKLFNSSILRATVSNLLNEFAGEYIAIPDRSSIDVDCYVLSGEEEDENREVIVDSVKVVEKKDFKALIMAVSDLDLDLAAMMDEPMGVIDSFKDENGNLKDDAKNLFADATSSKYSGILHATISKYVIEFSEEGNEGLTIVIPDEVLDSEDETLISCNETVNLLESLIIIGTEVLTDSEMSEEEMMNSIIGNVINNDKSLNSTIIRATLTNFIDDEETGISVPEAAFDSSFDSTNVISKNHVVDLLEAIDAMKEANEDDIDYYDLLDVNNINVSMLSTADSDANGNAISNSLILRGIVTDQLDENDIVVPSEAKDSSNVISKEESISLVAALTDILGEESTITNINIDNLTIGEFVTAKDKIKVSKVIRKLVTDKLEEQDDIEVPTLAYDTNITSCNVISEDQVGELIDGLGKVLNEEDKVTEINVENITTAKLQLASSNIQRSLVLNATIAKQLETQEETVAVPNEAYENKSQKILEAEEIENLINGLVELLGENAQVTNIDVESIRMSNLAAAVHEDNQFVQKSSILNATITKQLDGQHETVIVPADAYVDDEATIKKLKDEEISNLVFGLVELLGEDAQVTSIDVENIKSKDMQDAKPNMQASSILNATITKQLDDQDDVVVPAYAYKDDEAEEKELDSDELGFLIDGLVNLLGEDAQVTSIDVESIKSKDMKNAQEDIEASSILRATITNKLIEQESVVVPLEAYESAEAEIKVIESSEMGQIIDGLYNLLGEEAVMTDIDVESIKAKDMQNAKNNIKDSYVLNATITKQLDDQPSVLVPEEAYAETTGEDNMLLPAQMGELIDGIVNLLGEETGVNSINVDAVTTGDILSSKDNVKKSLVLNATITDKLEEQDSIKIPNSSYVDDEAIIKVLTENEVEHFIEGLVTILGENENVNSIQVNNISVGKINEAKPEIQGSLILNATIAEQLKTNNEVETPDSAFDEITTSYKLLSSSELDNLITGLNNLLGAETKINAIQVSNITIDKINSAKQQIADSHVLNATITKQIDNQSENLVVPSKTYVDDTEDVKELESEQMVSLLSGIHNLLPANSPVNDIDVSGLTLAKVSGAREEIKASYILRATITKHIDSNESVVVPNVSLDEAISETNKNALKENEVDALIDTMISLFNENQKINELEVDTLTIGKLNSRYEVGHEKEGQLILSSSYVLKATVTKNLKDKEGDVLLIPSKSYDEYNILTNNEMDKVFASLDIIFGETRISEMNSFSNINISTINDNSEVLADSYVIRGTISKELLLTNDVTIPVGSIDNNVTDYDLLTKDELKKFFAAIDTMDIEDISNINASSLNVNKEKTATLAASDVMRATITKNVKVNNSAVYALRSDVDVTKDVKGNDILVLNQAQVTNMINSLNVLAPNGSINVQLNLTTLSTLDEQDLDTLLSSNSIRLEVSKLILAISPITEHSKVDVYELPNNVDVNQEQKDIIAADEIKTFINSLV